jgi:hypothetical protein
MFMTRKCIITLFLFLCSLLSLAQGLGFTIADGKSKVTIPIQIHNNLIVVPVILNNRLPLRFILDTGVRTSILTQKTFGDILNLAYSRKYTISGPGGEKLVDAYITNNVSLELPGITGRGHALLVLDQDYLELRNYLGTEVHGILGYELFSRFIVKVDYEKKTLTLALPGKISHGNYHKIPITVEDTKPYIVTDVVFTNGERIKAKLLVDSGASHGIMLDPQTDSAINAPSETVSCIIGRGLGGEITGKVGRIKSLQMGKYLIPNAIANFPDPNSYFDSLKIGRTTRNGAIGGEVLSRFTVIFDFPNETLYLKKNASFKRGFHYNLSGMTVKAKGVRLNVFEITEVRPQSSAEKAGLKAGDVIVSLNGLSNISLDLNHVNALLNSKPGKKITLQIDRRGQKLKINFRLQDII